MKNKLVPTLMLLMLFASIMPLSVGSGSPSGYIRGFWHFDEGTGTTAYDSSGFNNNGTVYGGAMWSDGKLGKALDFDGVDDYVEVPDSDSLDVSGKMTLEAWIYPRTMTHLQVIVSKYNHSAPYNGAYYLGLGGYGYMNKILFGLSNDGYHYYYMLSNTNITANTWTHVAGTLNGTHMTLYINGNKDKVSSYAPGVIYASTAPFRIGCYLPELGFPRFFDGIIDEVKVSATTIWTVDDDKIQCPTADFTNIQDAINAASPGDTILVYDGTYNEALYIDKALTVKAASKPTVKGGQSVTTNYGNRDAVIFIENAAGVTIEGLDIEGEGLGTTNTKNYGVIFEESNGTIRDCVVSANTVGDMNSIGIGAWDGSDLTVEESTIENFGRIGVFYYSGCTGGVYDSEIIGQVYSDENEVNYGIEIEGWDVGCDIEIVGNEIYSCDNTYSSEPLWSSAAIVIDGWLAIEGYSAYMQSSTVEIEGNDIHDNYYGIEVVANSLSHAHHNDIYNNREYGVASDPDEFGNNMTFDARFNYWGSLLGPFHNDTNLPGFGDEVTDNVSYSPWLGFVAGTTPMTYHVNPTGKIQDAIGDASPGDTVKVYEGTYTEQLVIDKTLTLLGDPGPRIVAPDTRNTYTIAESTATWDPIIFAYGGTESGGAVGGSGTISVTIDGFEIDGGNKAATARFVGILCRNVNPGVVSNNNIHDMYDADGEGDGPQTFGIMVCGDSDVTLEFNEIRDFSRGGIGVQGDDGTLPDPMATVKLNTVLGNGLETGSGWWAENGIQIAWGAGGSIIENNVSGCQVNNPDWVATGIMAYDAIDGTDILDNTVADCDTGIAVISPSYDLVDGNVVTGCTWDGIRLGWPVDNCTVSNNIISDNWAGIGVWDASDNTIQKNIIENNEYGIYMDGDSNNNAILANDILNNVIDGIHIEPYGGFDPSGTKIHCNKIVGNGVSGVNKTGTEIVDATCNWWGSDTGPYHPTTNPDGTGDRVSDHVDYKPWKVVPTIKVEPPSHIAGQTNKTFTINITINDLVDCWKVTGIQFRLSYNNTLLEVVNLTAGSFMKDPQWNLHGIAFIDFIETDGSYGPHILVGIILYPNATGQWNAFPNGSGILATITFKTIYQQSGFAETPPLSCDLTLLDTLLSNVYFEEVPHNVENGLYKIYPLNLADVNNDGSVNIFDVAIAASAFGAWPGHPRWDPILDLNNDNVINIFDVAIAAANFGWFQYDC